MAELAAVKNEQMQKTQVDPETAERFISEKRIGERIKRLRLKKSMGLDITIVTSAESDDEGRELLRLMGMPFRRTETFAVGDGACGAHAAQPGPDRDGLLERSLLFL